jgi:Uma2 family endonuclease
MSAAETLEPHFYTVEEYLEMERLAPHKSEYYHGEIFSMAGGTPRHSYLASNMTIGIGSQLRAKKKSCRTYSSDLQIAISDDQYAYPDVAVVCGKETLSNINSMAITNPILIVEVTSKSSEGFDKGGKFRRYQQIRSFREYVLISQENILVEVYFKPDDADFWQYKIYQSLDEVIKLQSIDIEVNMADIYFDWESNIE